MVVHKNANTIDWNGDILYYFSNVDVADETDEHHLCAFWFFVDVDSFCFSNSPKVYRPIWIAKTNGKTRDGQIEDIQLIENLNARKSKNVYVKSERVRGVKRKKNHKRTEENNRHTQNYSENIWIGFYIYRLVSKMPSIFTQLGGIYFRSL